MFSQSSMFKPTGKGGVLTIDLRKLDATEESPPLGDPVAFDAAEFHQVGRKSLRPVILDAQRDHAERNLESRLGWNVRFEKLLKPTGKDGVLTIDVGKLDATEPHNP